MLLSLAVLTGARRGERCVRCRANSRNPARCSSCRRLVPPCSHRASADCPESRGHLDFACAGLTCPGRHPDSRALQSGPRGSHVVPRPKRRWEPCRQRSEARGHSVRHGAGNRQSSGARPGHAVVGDRLGQGEEPLSPSRDDGFAVGELAAGLPCDRTDRRVQPVSPGPEHRDSWTTNDAPTR